MLCALGAHSTDRMLCALGAHSKLKIPFDKTSTIIMQKDNMDGNNALWLNMHINNAIG